MKSSQFEHQFDTAHDDIPVHEDPDVKVVDEDGFVHDVSAVVYDPADRCLYIRTVWKESA